MQAGVLHHNRQQQQQRPPQLRSAGPTHRYRSHGHSQRGSQSFPPTPFRRDASFDLPYPLFVPAERGETQRRHSPSTPSGTIGPQQLAGMRQQQHRLCRPTDRQEQPVQGLFNPLSAAATPVDRLAGPAGEDSLSRTQPEASHSLLPYSPYRFLSAGDMGTQVFATAAGTPLAPASRRSRALFTSASTECLSQPSVVSDATVALAAAFISHGQLSEAGTSYSQREKTEAAAEVDGNEGSRRSRREASASAGFSGTISPVHSDIGVENSFEASLIDHPFASSVCSLLPRQISTPSGVAAADCGRRRSWQEEQREEAQRTPRTPEQLCTPKERIMGTPPPMHTPGPAGAFGLTPRRGMMTPRVGFSQPATPQKSTRRRHPHQSRSPATFAHKAMNVSREAHSRLNASAAVSAISPRAVSLPTASGDAHAGGVCLEEAAPALHDYLAPNRNPFSEYNLRVSLAALDGDGDDDDTQKQWRRCPLLPHAALVTYEQAVPQAERRRRHAAGSGLTRRRKHAQTPFWGSSSASPSILSGAGNATEATGAFRRAVAERRVDPNDGLAAADGSSLSRSAVAQWSDEPSPISGQTRNSSAMPSDTTAGESPSPIGATDSNVSGVRESGGKLEPSLSSSAQREPAHTEEHGMSLSPSARRPSTVGSTGVDTMLVFSSPKQPRASTPLISAETPEMATHSDSSLSPCKRLFAGPGKFLDCSLSLSNPGRELSVNEGPDNDVGPRTATTSSAIHTPSESTDTLAHVMSTQRGDAGFPQISSPPGSKAGTTTATAAIVTASQGNSKKASGSPHGPVVPMAELSSSRAASQDALHGTNSGVPSSGHHSFTLRSPSQQQHQGRHRQTLTPAEGQFLSHFRAAPVVRPVDQSHDESIGQSPSWRIEGSSRLPAQLSTDSGGASTPRWARQPSSLFHTDAEDDLGPVSRSGDVLSAADHSAAAVMPPRWEVVEDDDEEEEQEPGDRFIRHHAFQFAHRLPTARGDSDTTATTTSFVPLSADVNGLVWLATHRLDGRPYAVKEVLLSSAQRERQLAVELACLTVGHGAATQQQRAAEGFLVRYYACAKTPTAVMCARSTSAGTATGGQPSYDADPLGHVRPEAATTYAEARGHAAAAAAGARGRVLSLSPGTLPLGPGSGDTTYHDAAGGPSPVALLQTEYFPNGSLWEFACHRRRCGGPGEGLADIPWATVLAHGLMGLEALHGSSLVHGCPLPFNIFVGGSTHGTSAGFKLGNFGSAAASPALYPSTAPQCTLPPPSPAQQRHLSPYETDVYVLCSGLVALFAAALRPALAAADFAESVMAEQLRECVTVDAAVLHAEVGCPPHVLRLLQRVLTGSGAPLTAAAALEALGGRASLAELTACRLYDDEIARLERQLARRRHRCNTRATARHPPPLPPMSASFDASEAARWRQSSRNGSLHTQRRSRTGFAPGISLSLSAEPLALPEQHYDGNRSASCGSAHDVSEAFPDPSVLALVAATFPPSAPPEDALCTHATQLTILYKVTSGIPLPTFLRPLSSYEHLS